MYHACLIGVHALINSEILNNSTAYYYIMLSDLLKQAAVTFPCTI